MVKLYVHWYDGSSNTYTYSDYMQAEKAIAAFKIAFGDQIVNMYIM